MSSGVAAALVAVIALYAAFVLFALLFADRLILPAPLSSYRLSAVEEFSTIRATDGVELAAVHLPREDARYTILYSHGNGEDLGNMLPVLEELHRLGFAVFAYDYRGYGASGGRATVQGILLDAEAAYRHVTEALGVPGERVLLYGRSVGGGPSVHLAARSPVAGVVLEATFTSAFQVVTRWPILPFDRLRNLRLLRAMDVPVLFIHGRQDRVVPFRHGPRLHAKARGPKWSVWVDDAGHNDLWLVARDEIGRALLDFADAIAASRGARAG